MVAAFDAADCVFHGMGHEDIDVLCLGPGRPFVMELKRARKHRSTIAKFEAMRAEVNAAAAPAVALSGW